MSTKKKQVWTKVESRTHPGTFYFFNRKTKATSWHPPSQENTSEVNVVTAAAKVESRGKDESQRAKKTKPPKLNLQSNNNGKMDSAQPISVVGAPPGSASGGASNYGWYSEGSVTASVGESEMEDMDCEERWGDDGEVSMDFDVSEVQQEQLIAEITQTRETLLPTTTITSFDLLDTTTATYQDMLYFVLDTNVLISHLQFLVELKDFAIKGIGKPVLVVPWAVMQELDALKTRDSQSLSTKARKAIDMLHSCFAANHPRVRGQTMQEVQTEKNNIAIGNNDDRILHCCMVYQEKVKGHGGLVVLFSNDIQLCSKALLHRVKAYNRKTLFNELRKLCKGNVQAPPTSYTHTKEYASRVEDGQKLVAMTNLVDDLICQSEAIVRETLATIIKAEMIEAFGDRLWIQVVKVKPPWSLRDLVMIIDKHWIAVFGLVLPRNLKSTVEGLLSYTRKRAMNIGGNLELETFHRLAYNLLIGFSSKSDYGGRVPHCLTQLSVLSQKGLETKAGLLPSPRQPTPTTATFPSPVQSSVSPTMLPPTPPATPGQSPLAVVSVFPDYIIRLAQAVPPDPPDQLPWLLSLILEIVKHSHAYILELSTRDKHQAVTLLSSVTFLLQSIIRAIDKLIASNLHLEAVKEVIDAFNDFLLKATDSHFAAVCPLTLPDFYTLLHGSESHREMMTSSYKQFQHYLAVYSLLQQSLHN